MDSKTELLSTLREFLHKGPKVIKEDIEPEVIAQVDIVPLQFERVSAKSGTRKFLISLIGHETAASRGASDERIGGNTGVTVAQGWSPGNFDGGVEFISRNSQFWELPDEELNKYRVGFIPRSRSDIPDKLPDYKGYVYEPGGLNAAWDDSLGGEEPSDEMDVQARLDAGLDIESEGELSRVYDVDSKQWVDVPSDELPNLRPIGSFGYPRLQRHKEKGEYKYSVYRRRLPSSFADPRFDKRKKESHDGAGYMTDDMLKTPWMMFMDWWHVTFDKIIENGMMELSGGTDTVSRDPRTRKPGQDNRTQMARDLMARVAQLNKQIEDAKEKDKDPSKLEYQKDVLEGQYQQLARYGILGMGDERDERDYTKPPVAFNGRHPRKHSSKWGPEVDRLNAAQQKTVLGPSGREDFSQKTYSVSDTSDVPSQFDVDNPLATTLMPMWGKVRAADLRQQQDAKRMNLHRGTPIGKPAKKSPKEEDLPSDLASDFARLSAFKQLAALKRSAVRRAAPERLGESFDLAQFASDDDDIDDGQKTHCSKCQFPTEVFGVDPYEDGTRRKNPEHAEDDVHVIQFILNRDLSKLPAAKGKWEISLDAAQNFVDLIKGAGLPSWLKVSIDTDTYDTEEAEGYDTPEIEGKPRSTTHGRITFTTDVRQPGRIPGHQTVDNPYDYDPSSNQFKNISAKIAKGAKTSSADPAPVGHISSHEIETGPRGGLKISLDPETAQTYDARQLASANPEVRDQAWDDLKSFVRDWYSTGSMGAAKAAGRSSGQRKVKAAKDRQFREKQVEQFYGLIDKIKRTADSWITLNGLPAGYTEAEILEALSKAFKKMQYSIEPTDLTVEKFDGLSRKVRENILKFLERTSKNVEVELGDLLEGVHQFSKAVEVGDLGRAAWAQTLIEDASDKLTEEVSYLDEDIAQLLRYRGRCNFARRALYENRDVYAAALILRGNSARGIGTFSESELEEIRALRIGVVTESVRPSVIRASQILSMETYDQALTVFKRVLPRLGLDDLKYLPVIAPQKILSDGRLCDMSLESVLNDIGLNSITVLSNSKNGTSTDIWDKIGNL